MNHLDRDDLEDVINATYPGLRMFARDANLPPEFAELYRPGMVIRERGFTDATPLLGGMVTTHRYVILSNHMGDIAALLGDEQPAVPEWELHVAPSGSHFKVLERAVVDGRTLIFLLHLPNDERWRLLASVAVNIDEALLTDALRRMEHRLAQPPIAAVVSPAWLDRCRFPLGMSDDGELFPLG